MQIRTGECQDVSSHSGALQEGKLTYQQGGKEGVETCEAAFEFRVEVDSCPFTGGRAHVVRESTLTQWDPRRGCLEGSCGRFICKGRWDQSVKDFEFQMEEFALPGGGGRRSLKMFVREADEIGRAHV